MGCKDHISFWEAIFLSVCDTNEVISDNYMSLEIRVYEQNQTTKVCLNKKSHTYQG